MAKCARCLGPLFQFTPKCLQLWGQFLPTSRCLICTKSSMNISYVLRVCCKDFSWISAAVPEILAFLSVSIWHMAGSFVCTTGCSPTQEKSLKSNVFTDLCPVYCSAGLLLATNVPILSLQADGDGFCLFGLVFANHCHHVTTRCWLSEVFIASDVYTSSCMLHGCVCSHNIPLFT